MATMTELERMFFTGKISRRQFLAQASALGLTAALSPALLATRAQAATPKKGGRLRIACAGAQTSDSFDPEVQVDIDDIAVFIKYFKCEPI